MKSSFLVLKTRLSLLAVVSVISRLLMACMRFSNGIAYIWDQKNLSLVLG